MEPNPTWDPEAYAETVETLAALPDDVTVSVWGADWCGDCRGQLPDFAAALDAAGIEGDRLAVYPVEREDGEKVGPKVEEYGIEFIPTVVVERDGTELARFVEREDRPAAVYLADRLADETVTA